MNICIVTSSFPSHRDDIAHAPFVIPFIEGLKRKGHQVFLFTQDREGVKEEFLEGVQVKWFPWMKSNRPLVQLNPMNPWNCLRIGSLFYHGNKALLPFLKENKMNACLALWVLPSGYFAHHAYRRTGIPYSIWALGSDIYRYGRNPLLYPMMKRIIQEATGVFADGFDLGKRVEERYGRKCSFLATTRIIPLNPPLLRGGEEGLLLKGGEEGLLKDGSGGSGSRPHHFLFVGRLEKMKGIDLLLQSMAFLSEEKLGVHLTIVGKGKMQEWVKSFIHQKGLGEWITFLGEVSDKRLARLYASSDCVVIPSRSESIPLVFSEALNFDKELIVTDVGDMGILGRQYEAAWVIPPEDPIALKEMMKKRVECQHHPMRQDQEKREELKRLFNIEASVDRFLSDYK